MEGGLIGLVALVLGAIGTVGTVIQAAPIVRRALRGRRERMHLDMLPPTEESVPGTQFRLFASNDSDVSERPDSVHIVLRARRPWWFPVGPRPTRRAPVEELEEGRVIGERFEARARVVIVDARYGEWEGPPLPDRECEQILEWVLSGRRRRSRKIATLARPHLLLPAGAPRAHIAEVPALPTPGPFVDRAPVPTVTERPTFDVQRAGVKPYSDGQVWLSVEVKNPTERAALSCAGQFRAYIKQEFVSGTPMQEPERGHPFAWSTATGPGGRITTDIRSQDFDVLDLVFSPGRASDVFYHSGINPTGKGYEGIAPRGVGRYVLVLDIATLSDHIATTRVFVPFVFEATASGNVLRFDAEHDVGTQRVPGGSPTPLAPDLSTSANKQ